jgi:uncharacterized protein YcfJ
MLRAMNTKLIIAGIVGAISVTALGVAASYNMDPAEYAKVVNVTPVTKSISVPREECQDEAVTLTRPTQDPNQIVGTVGGAIVGGVIGSQVGGGSGKKVAIAGGAVAGGVAGNKIQEGIQERNVYQGVRHVCATVYDRREEADGYDVTYQSGGKDLVIRTDYDPGRRIQLENGTAVRSR